MIDVNTRLNDLEIAEAVEEIKKLKDEKNITWKYVFDHCPNVGKKSVKTLTVAVSTHSVAVNYEGILEFLRSAKCLDRVNNTPARIERANAISKRKKELGISYAEMFRFFEGRGKISKNTFIDQVRRGYGGYTTDLIKWLNELTPEALAELRRPSEEEAQEFRKHFEENSLYIDEINKIKDDNNLTWNFLFSNTDNGCKNKYRFKKAIETASGTDFKRVYEDLKKIDFEKMNETKKAKKKKSKSYKKRYGRSFEGRRLHKVYAKENGVFGLQMEYLE